MSMTRCLATSVLGAGFVSMALAAPAHRAEVPVAAAMRSSAFPWESFTPQATRVGAVRRVFDTPTPTLSQLEMHITTLKPGESPHPPHRHPEEELIIVKEGTIESNLDGVLRRLGPGSVIFHASNEPHTVKNVGASEATYHVIKWRSAATPAP